jgi:hypothetical protein
LSRLPENGDADQKERWGVVPRWNQVDKKIPTEFGTEQEACERIL